jgi:hypothetical protein
MNLDAVEAPFPAPHGGSRELRDRSLDILDLHLLRDLAEKRARCGRGGLER